VVRNILQDFNQVGRPQSARYNDFQDKLVIITFADILGDGDGTWKQKQLIQRQLRNINGEPLQ